MLDDSTATRLAMDLDRAEQTRTPIPQLSLSHPDMTVEDAYAVQRAWTAWKLSHGRTLVGRKIGLTSRVMQRSAGITEPDHGAIYDDMVFADRGAVVHDLFIAPRIEVELAFVLGSSLRGPDCTLEDVLAATDHVLPALELLDARVQMEDPGTGHRRTIVDTIADNAADAGLITGQSRIDPATVDLAWIPAVLRRNGVIEESGVSAAVLEHPAKGVAWLANKLAAFDVTLDAGLVILSGSFTQPIFAHPGDVFEADFGVHGTVGCTFT